MNPQDDPEARIRELERPLETAARELGADPNSSQQSTGQYDTGQYSTPAYGAPTYQAPQYGAPQYEAPQYGAPPNDSPYPPTTPWPAANSPYGTQSPYTVPYGSLPQQQKPSGGYRPWMLMIGVAVVGLVIIGGAFAFIGFNMTGADDQITGQSQAPSGVLGGGGSVDRIPTGQPTATISIPDFAPGLPTEVVPPGGEISVAGVGQTKTIECNDHTVTISGVSNTITITGHCRGVTVSGMQNILVIDDSDTISASGVDNKVTYRSGNPDVQNSGFDNIVEQG